MTVDHFLTHPLIPLLLHLGTRLGMVEKEAQRRETIRAFLTEAALMDPEEIPQWVLDILTNLIQGQTTGWTDFPRSDKDETNVFYFLRDLPAILPATYENNEENWLWTFPAIQMEVCIFFEGSCYKVSELGKTWE
jgi:hypothetical protein